MKRKKVPTKQKKIPDEWRLFKSGSLMDVRDGTHDSPKRQEIGIPLVTSKNITDIGLNFNDCYYISKNDAQKINKRSKVEKDDLIFSMIGSVGNVALIKGEAKFCIKNVGLFKHNKSAVVPQYLLFFFKSNHTQNRIKSLLNGGIQKFLGLGELRKLELLFPPLSEQKLIVEILEMWDSYLEKLEKKIEIKKKIKKGLMQQLLTGKKRLKGFNGKWKNVPIGSIGDIVTGSTPLMKDESNYGNDYCWVTAEDFNGKYIFNTKIKLSKKGKELTRFLPKGSILITCIASIGKNAIAGVPLATNQQINSVIVNEKNNNEFFYYYINQFTNLLKKFAGIGAVPILNKVTFSNIKIYIPSSIKEQSVIAKILSTADEEIEVFEKQKEKAEAQKKYLLNNLITGKIRLPEFRN